MWSCDRNDSKNSGPIVDVLNGDYPEADVGRMSLSGLEKLVAALVRYTTAENAANRPKWWPKTIVYNRKINLGLDDEREIKLALKQLIVNCSQFFKERAPDVGTKWSIGWSDENQQRKGTKRIRMETKTAANPKRYRPLVHLPSAPCEPLISPIERPEPPPRSPNKSQFLHYFELNPKQSKIEQPVKSLASGATAKLTNCVHIPFSSDVGKIMAAREHHCMSEEVKLKRLERSEWYTNKEIPRVGEVEYEYTPVHREPNYCHWYKMPKRQCHHRRQGVYDAEFLSQFCTPVYVHLDRLDLNKIQSVRNKEKKQLVVMIDTSEKMCCDAKIAPRIVRTSPRLRNV